MLRLACEADGAAVAAIYGPVVRETAISFEETPPDAEEMGRRIMAVQPHYPWLVMEADGRILGYAYGSSHRARAAYRFSVESSVYVAEAERMRGVAHRLYRALFAVLTAQQYINVFAGITLPNTASVRLHAQFGFQEIGVYPRIGYKMGKWHDVGWYGLQLQEPVAIPREPIDVASIDLEEILRTAG